VWKLNLCDWKLEIEGNKHIGFEGLGTKKCELKKSGKHPRWREQTC
jgi:hypothetical protein